MVVMMAAIPAPLFAKYESGYRLALRLYSWNLLPSGDMLLVADYVFHPKFLEMCDLGANWAMAI